MAHQWALFDLALEKVTLRVHRTGGDKPKLVLAHGFSDNGLYWTAAARELEADFDIIMYDARGHGFSPLPGEGLDREAMVEDLAGLIQALELDRPALMGHSMGAGTVAGLAAKHPGLTRGIVLEDPAWRDPAPGDRASRPRGESMREQFLRYRAMGREAVIQECREKNPNWPQVQCEIWAETKLQLDLRITEQIGGLLPDWRALAGAITCPALLITGDPERGAIVTPEVAAEACRLMPHGQRAHIPGAGHSIRSDQLALFLGAVRPFLTNL